MNRVFKSVWSDIHQQYVVTNEHQTRKGKSTKSAVALAVACALMGTASLASAAYVQGSSQYRDVNWTQDREYQADWGLEAMNAEKAYELGFYGQGQILGMVDSGALFSHVDLQGQLKAIEISGKYGTSGNRYQQWKGLTDKYNTKDPFGQFKKGDSFDHITSDWMAGKNDSHGTHCAGTIVGARDEENREGNFQGVSFGSTLVVGNHGGTDNTAYGPIKNDRDYTGDDPYKHYNVLDYNLFRAIYDGVVAGGARFINNSWGTNTRVAVNPEKPNWDREDLDKDGKVDPNYDNINTNNPYQEGKKGDIAQGYVGEWWAVKQINKHQGQERDFVDAAWDAVKGKDAVQIFTTGNRNLSNAFYRPAYPHFYPEAERQWVAVAGTDHNGKQDEYITYYNDGGIAKWWTVAAPGNGIYSSIVNDDGTQGWGNKSGTSMSAPHVTGALGVLASRYPYLTAPQIRDVMFTTANQNLNIYNKDDQAQKPDDLVEGVPHDTFGWGMPDLEKGMYGPGQLLGKTDVAMKGYSDHWSNDISQKAWDARFEADKAELKAVLTSIEGGTGAEAEKEYWKLRKQALADRLGVKAETITAATVEQTAKKDWYNGTLTVAGTGNDLLVLTGDNTFVGGVTVEKGATVLGFGHSFGKDDNGKGLFNINEGARGGVVFAYRDKVTDKDLCNDKEIRDVVVNINGGTLLVAADYGHTVDTVNVGAKGGKVQAWANDYKLASIYNLAKDDKGGTLSKTLTVKNGDLSKLVAAEDDMLFFNSKVTIDADKKKINASIWRDETKTFGMFASNSNENAVAVALEKKGGSLFEAMLGSTDKTQFQGTLEALSSDFYLNTQSAAILNTFDLSRSVKDVAAHRAVANTATLAHDVRLWAMGIGSKGEAENVSSVDNDFYAGLVGVDTRVFGNTTLGAFFGAGSTDFKGGRFGKLESDDVHFGLYGNTELTERFSVAYGVTHTKQDRTGGRTISNVMGESGSSDGDSNAKQTAFYAEGAYKAFEADNGLAVTPYAGWTFIHAESDGVNEQIGKYSLETTVADQDVNVATLGVRANLPVVTEAVAFNLKSDLSWNRFFGDNQAEAVLGGSVRGATITGAELDNVMSLGLGVDAMLGKQTTFGLSYTGNFNGDVKSNGISANLRYVF